MKTTKLKVKVFNIDWDTDGEHYKFKNLPSEVEMDFELTEEDSPYLDVFIAERLSYDYCHQCYRFDYKVLERENSHFFTISLKEGKTECEDCPFRQWSSMAQDWIGCKSAPFPCDKYNLATMQFEK